MPRRSREIGRPGSLNEARELVALLASLSDAGDALTAQAIAERLGVSEERAHHLMTLVMTSSAAGGAPLPLTEDGAGELALTFSGGMHGRAVRLTRGETTALEAALAKLGIPGDDPLRARLAGALAREGRDPDLVRRHLASDEVATNPGTLGACSQALARREALTFCYASPSAPAGERHVLPSSLRHEDGAWYLDAYDLGRAGERTFRLDRMSDAHATPAEELPPRDEKDPARRVRIRLDDPSLIDQLDWHGATVTPRPDGSVEAELPLYGGPWLARMVAACGSSAHLEDASLAESSRAAARELLGRLPAPQGAYSCPVRQSPM